MQIQTLKVVEERTWALFSLEKKTDLLYIVNMKNSLTKKKKNLVMENIFIFEKALFT